MNPIPWQIREAVRNLLGIPEALRTAGSRSGIRRAGGDRVRVGFGNVLDDGRPVHGGAVKLLALRDAFGGDGEAFDILYAVSSSQPRFAEGLVRHCLGQGIRFVWNQNGVGYPAWAGRESERFNAPMRKLRAMADFVIYQSEFCRVSAEKFLGPCGKPSAVIFNPVDTNVFSPDDSRRADPRRPRLLAAGTHGTRDRVIPVLDALGILRAGGIGAELTVAGRFHWRDGEADFAREVGARGLGECVRRVARFSQADAPEMYRQHDVLVHPKYMDPCPTVVLEAMASGLPVVGSHSGGMPEIVGDRCGCLVRVAEDDYDARHPLSGAQMADAVAAVLADLESMAAASRRHAVDCFSVEDWVARHAEIFADLCR